MEWILNCFADIRDWVPGHDAHCKRLREDGKLIEFCGRSNKAGLFIAISIFYGKARRGCVMIPASLKGPVNSRQKGLRELRGLISTVNHDGVSSKGRNQGSSASLGAITSFKWVYDFYPGMLRDQMILKSERYVWIFLRSGSVILFASKKPNWLLYTLL